MIYRMCLGVMLLVGCVDPIDPPNVSEIEDGLAICRECQYACVGACDDHESICYRGCSNNAACETDCLDGYNSCVDRCFGN